MKRYDIDDDAVEHEHPAGEFVKYEDVEPIVADRDIKAANLQLLVEDVLAYDDACSRCERNGNDGGDVHEAVETWKHLVDLARSLKQ